MVYHITNTIVSVEIIKALSIAIKGVKTKLDDLIHYSNRGIQNCLPGYVSLLKDIGSLFP